MKKIVLAAAMVSFAGVAFAGGMSEPVMEPTIVTDVVETTAGTSGGVIVPLLILALIGLAASS